LSVKVLLENFPASLRRDQDALVQCLEAEKKAIGDFFFATVLREGVLLAA